MIGRATLYGTAAAGEAGAARAIAILAEEIRRVMGILGCRDIASIGRDQVIVPHLDGRVPDIATPSSTSVQLAASGG